jgi:hypothetical protein
VGDVTAGLGDLNLDASGGGAGGRSWSAEHGFIPGLFWLGWVSEPFIGRTCLGCSAAFTFYPHTTETSHANRHKPKN